MSVTYHRTAERPALEVTWLDDNGQVIDLTAAALTVKVGATGRAALLTKTLGVDGAATAPNVVITWAAGELDLPVGVHRMQITATESGLDRVCVTSLTIADIVT